MSNIIKEPEKKYLFLKMEYAHKSEYDQCLIYDFNQEIYDVLLDISTILMPERGEVELSLDIQPSFVIAKKEYIDFMLQMSPSTKCGGPYFYLDEKVLDLDHLKTLRDKAKEKRNVGDYSFYLYRNFHKV